MLAPVVVNQYICTCSVQIIVHTLKAMISLSGPSVCVCVLSLQERLKDIIEKVTVVSQHRMESLKVGIQGLLN